VGHTQILHRVPGHFTRDIAQVTLCGNHDGWSLALYSVKAHSQAHTIANSPLVIG